MDVPPSPTIYIKNLNDRIQKEELRRTLYGLFSQFGGILDVVALKTNKMRGQAFIVFKDVGCASNALRSMQKFPLFDKPMSIQYAKAKSYATMKEDGTLQKHLAQQRKAKQSSADTNGEPPAKMIKMTPVATASEGTNNTIVYCSNLPQETTKEMLLALFGELKGLVEVRLVEGRPDIAFVEFSTEQEAGIAISALDGFQVDAEHKMSVAFAKK
ncbi:uncharacterized protein MONBRDRAFT_6131 [Monosiga brevicollis MX1]|uniref:RRM domain-containing protein n=1 Tax=Monosiga brevicollis TaxID=81824 RepID=A9USX1_MONBE|nr:uncharacterized protein MONBRDRAFT_6131 [Monosiga brevicollis MX1]EDQ91398.1 predicted protein [Monosiga brevicollis MX1]|eukprot:XP_001743820.1 hypothetical protein [Monosiga brevicollis MX1]